MFFCDSSVAVLLGKLLADELACGTRRTAVAAQGEALCEQMQLVAVELESALVGQLLDDVQVLVLVRHREGDFGRTGR